MNIKDCVWMSAPVPNDETVLGFPIFWIGRIGVLCQLAGALPILLDVVGERRLQAWTECAQQWLTAVSEGRGLRAVLRRVRSKLTIPQDQQGVRVVDNALTLSMSVVYVASLVIGVTQTSLDEWLKVVAILVVVIFATTPVRFAPYAALRLAVVICPIAMLVYGARLTTWVVAVAHLIIVQRSVSAIALVIGKSGVRGLAILLGFTLLLVGFVLVLLAS